MENKTTNRAKMSNKRCLKARLQYLQRGYKTCEATPQAIISVLLYFSGFSCWLAWFVLQIFSLNNKIHFSSGLKTTVFAQLQTTNKLVNEAANDSAWVSGQDRKIPPALETNQITGFGGFPPASKHGKK